MISSLSVKEVFEAATRMILCKDKMEGNLHARIFHYWETLANGQSSQELGALPFVSLTPTRPPFKFPPSTFGNDLKKIWESGTFSDVTLYPSDDSEGLATHQIVLAARCPSLFALISKSTSSSVSLDFPRNVCEVLLQFLYSDNLERVQLSDPSLCLGLQQVARNLSLLKLEQHLSDSLDSEGEGESEKPLPQTLQEDFVEFWKHKDEKLSPDVTFEVKGKTFGCHKALLSTRSSYFTAVIFLEYSP